MSKSLRDDNRTSGVVLGATGSVLCALFIGGLYEYLSLRGLINMTATWVVLIFVWFLGIIGIVLAELIWGERRRHRSAIGATASVMLAVLLVALNRVISWVPVTSPSAQIPLLTEIVTSIRKEQQPHLGVQLIVDRSSDQTVNFHFDASNAGAEDVRLDKYEWSDPDGAGDTLASGYPPRFLPTGTTVTLIGTAKDGGLRSRNIVADFQYHSTASATQRLWVARCRFVLPEGDLSYRQFKPKDCAEQEGEILSTEAELMRGLQRPAGTLAFIFSGTQTSKDIFVLSNNRRYFYNAEAGTVKFSDVFPDGVNKEVVSRVDNKSHGTHSVLVTWREADDFIGLTVD